MTRWRIATIICTIILVLTLLTAASLAIVTIHESRVLKNSVEVALGSSPGVPALSQLELPALPPAGAKNELVTPFARFAGELVSRLEYHKTLGGLTPPTVLTSLGTFSSSSGTSNGWLLSDANDVLWLVFRGTSTKDEWKKDFELQQVPFLTRMVSSAARRVSYPQLADQPSTRANFFPDDAAEGIEVHSGFMSIYSNIRELLLDVLNVTTFTHMCVTGHSLGAAHALYATLDLALTFPSVTFDTVTFGCPRAGNSAFANAVATHPNVNSLVLLANTCDMVTDVPLATQPTLTPPYKTLVYTHPGSAIHNFTDNREGWIENHMMHVYLDYLAA